MAFLTFSSRSTWGLFIITWVTQHLWELQNWICLSGTFGEWPRRYISHSAAIMSINAFHTTPIAFWSGRRQCIGRRIWLRREQTSWAPDHVIALVHASYQLKVGPQLSWITDTVCDGEGTSPARFADAIAPGCVEEWPTHCPEIIGWKSNTRCVMLSLVVSFWLSSALFSFRH